MFLNPPTEPVVERGEATQHPCLHYARHHLPRPSLRCLSSVSLNSRNINRSSCVLQI